MLMATSLTHARPLTTVAATSASFYPSRLVPQPPDLIKWVRRESGFVHQSIKIAQLEEGSNGLGLVAAENIPKGSDLISLPRHIPLKFEAADAEDGAHSTLVNLARNVPVEEIGVTPVHLSDDVLLAVAGIRVKVSAEVVATAGRGPFPEEEKLLSTKKGDRGVQAPVEAPC